MSTLSAVIDPSARTVTLRTTTGQRRAWARILDDRRTKDGNRCLILDRRVHRQCDLVVGWHCAGGYATVMMATHGLGGCSDAGSGERSGGDVPWSW